MKELRVKLTFTDEVLGMMPANKDIHEQYIASNAPDAPSIEEEVEAVGVEGVVEKTMTVFPKMDDGTPFMWDYQLRGMFKDAIGMLRKLSEKECSKVKAYKKAVDGLIFIKERKVPFVLSGALGNCQRPLRAETMQGPRVALAHSETVPEGSSLTFTILLMDESLEKAVRECLDYGIYRGLGQWRNAGKGRFEWEEV